MASDSLPPPPTSGGGYAKYLIGLLLLLGGGLGVFLATRAPEAPPVAVTPPPVQKAERSTALTDDSMQIPVDDATEDAGSAAPAQAVVKKPRRTGASDSWACEGDVPAQEIRTVLSDRQAQIRSCYERRLRVNNLLQGDIRLQVKIGNDGTVQATRVSGNLRDAEVSSCIQNIAKKWTFPPPSGGACAVFDAPYHFTPKT